MGGVSRDEAKELGSGGVIKSTYGQQGYIVLPAYPSTCYLYLSTYLLTDASSLPTTYLPIHLPVIFTYHLPAYLSSLPTYSPTCYFYLPSTYLSS